jgi:hypothetical protein
LRDGHLATKKLFPDLRLPIEHLAQLPPIPIPGRWQTQRASVDRTAVSDHRWDVARRGENDHVRRKVGHLGSETGQTVQFMAHAIAGDAPVPLALNVPPFAAGTCGLDRHHVAPFTGSACPPVPVYSFELTATAGELVDQTFKIIRREAPEGIRAPGGGCKASKPGQV